MSISLKLRRPSQPALTQNRKARIRNW